MPARMSFGKGPAKLAGRGNSIRRPAAAVAKKAIKTPRISHFLAGTPIAEEVSRREVAAGESSEINLDRMLSQ